LFSLVELEVIADRTIRFSSQLWPICFWITEKRWKKEKDTDGRGEQCFGLESNPARLYYYYQQ
jgi:hypothetical protein